MTDTKHTPDRIWAKDAYDSWGQYGHWYRYSKSGGVGYLLSTPTREAAPELLQALELIKTASNCSSSRDIARAAIAKAKGEGA